MISSSKCFFIIFFIIVVLMVAQVISIKGGMIFKPGQCVETNELFTLSGQTESNIKGTVLKSNKEKSTIRFNNCNVIVSESKQKNPLVTVNNDFFIGNITCNVPEEVFTINSILNIEGSCWYDTALYALIIPNLTYAYVQYAIWNLKDSIPSDCDSEVIELLDLYINSIRSNEEPSIKESNMSNFVKVWKGSYMKDSCICKYEGDVKKFLFNLLNALDISAHVAYYMSIEEIDFNYETNGRKQILMLISDNNTNIKKFDKVDYKDYELCSIVPEVIVSRKDHPERPRYWRKKDYNKEMYVKYNMIGHVTCICKCGNGWLYYDDNDEALAGPFDSPMELFSEEGEGGLRLIPFKRFENYGPMIQYTMIFAAK